MSALLSAMVGKNEELIEKVATLYLNIGDVVVDVNYGKGNFWKKIDTSKYRTYFTDLQSDNVDMRNLPYEPGFADVVVLDPPYMYSPKGTVKGSLHSPYNLNSMDLLKTNDAVLQLYYDGMQEANRILKRGGRLLVKCQDMIEANRQRWNHINIYAYALHQLNLYAKDLFVLQQAQQPALRWKKQKHARKNHSYLWVFEKLESKAVAHQQSELKEAANV